MRFVSILALVVLVGCKSAEEVKNTQAVWNIKQDRVGVIVGCTYVNPACYNGWNGACPGTDRDTNLVAGELAKRKIPYNLLFNQKATAQNVINAAVAASKSLNNGGLLILYFSGHGGQLAGGANELDGKDETMCLWDGQLRDDVVWSLLTSIDPARDIKVFMVTDCCNSGSNYRLARNYSTTLKSRVFTARGERKLVIPNLLHWGGCGNHQSSYGSSVGGSFTLTWKKALDKNLTYRQTQDFIKGNLKGQVPTFATLGVFDVDQVVFEK